MHTIELITPRFITRSETEMVDFLRDHTSENHVFDLSFSREVIKLADKEFFEVYDLILELLIAQQRALQNIPLEKERYTVDLSTYLYAILKDPKMIFEAKVALIDVLHSDSVFNEEAL